MSAPSTILDLIEAFRRSKTMFAAAEFAIFDRLAEAPATASELSVALTADAGALERLLDGCVGLGLLTKTEGCYANTAEAATYLVSSSPQTLTGYILYSNRMLYPMWANLQDAIREGTPRWKQTFDLDGPLFDRFFNTEESLRTFLRGMHGLGMISSPKVVAAFDLSRFRCFVDLGGATGHLALAARNRYPNLRAIVFELARVAAVAREHAGNKVEIQVGDFFNDPLPEADLYAIGQILHDWPEEKINRLLRKIYDSLPSGGGLLIAEKLLEVDKAGPVPAQMQSINMLVCTEGKERALEEYRVLLNTAGFTSVEGKRTGTPLDAVLALKE
jgi:SAM-dependent methyltransferase